MSAVAMSETAVLEHYEERLAGEKAHVVDHYDELMEAAQGLKNARDYLTSVVEDPVHTLRLTAISPLISHVLLRKAYADLPRPPRIDDSMRTFVGGSLLEFIDPPESEGSVSGEIDPQALPGICSYMEFAFFNAYEQASGRSVHELAQQPVISVYHDESGRPLILQKSKDEANGLLLEPADASGVRIPAGTSVGLGIAMKVPGYITGNMVQPDGTKLFTYMVPEGLRLMPRRATPWIHADPADRALFAVNNYYQEGPRMDHASRIEHTTSLSLEDFREAAANVMSLCGV